jgi:cellulose biosynthesis protein BcsQ
LSTTRRRPGTVPLVVVAHEDAGIAESLRHALEADVGWRAVVVPPEEHALAAAVASGVTAALIGCGALADLPARRAVPVLAVGDDTRPADLRAALSACAVGMLTWPDDAADLPARLRHAVARGTAHDPSGGAASGAPPPRTPAGVPPAGTGAAPPWTPGGTPAAGIGAVPSPPGHADPADPAPPGAHPDPRPPREEPTVVVVAGAQGGVGTTTLAAHLAGAWARWGPAPVLLADLAGGLAFRLDLAPGALSWSAAAAIAVGPERALPASVLGQPWPGLSVLPLLGASGAAATEPLPEPWAVQAVLDAARGTFRLVVVDLAPRGGDAASAALAAALAAADVLLLVARPDRAGLDALDRLAHTWSASGRDPGDCGAVVAGYGPGAPVDLRTIRAHLGARLWAAIPSASAELAAAGEDASLLLDRAELPAIQAMLALAHGLVPFPETVAR